MSLKKSIVVVNEYTVKTGSGTGSRGASPGDYVLRYMARDAAVEDITPARVFDTDDYLIKYMARDTAAERLDSIPDLKLALKDAAKFGGVAFGYGDVALSDARLRDASKDIQYNFDKGKTVFKTIISFDEAYLREHGLIEEDFTCKQRGDYRGHIDQLKLRSGIMNGLAKMSRNYDDLQYVGVIQVDTNHVHCHLAMVDRGRGNLMPNGQQRGKLTALDKRNFRRGVDTYLDRKQQVKMMSSSVMYDKRNALCYIKKFTHKMLNRQGLPQFLLACLPEDRNLWRASTNRKEMKKANTVVRDYVTTVLSQNNSGYQDAVKSVTAYADYRKEREDLSNDEYNKLVRNGQQRIVDDCINGVYSVLKRVPKEQMTVRTPMLDVMSLDYEEIAAQAVNDPMVEFGFKLRSYSSRMSHHKKEYHKYRDEYRNYEQAENKSEDSAALGDYLKVEMDYNAMLMVKYQYFLSFLPPDDALQDEFANLMDEMERLADLKKMQQDPSFQRMQPDTAEEYGRLVYGQYGGHRLKSMPQVFERRVARMQAKIDGMTSAFRDKLQDCGMDFNGEHIVRKKMYPFADVKALDLHHLGYDFPYDVTISKLNIDKFKDVADKRYFSFQRAKDYLLGSGQKEALKVLPEQDITFMKEYADKLSAGQVLVTTRPTSGTERKKHNTIPLDANYIADIDTIIKSTVQSVQMDV